MKPRTNSKDARRRARERRAVQTVIDVERDKVDASRAKIQELRAKLRAMR